MKTVYGKIENMSGNANPEDRDMLTIKLVTIGDDNEKQHIVVILNNARYYGVVSDAFEHGRIVRVCGIYKTSGRKGIIDDGTITIAE